MGYRINLTRAGAVSVVLECDTTEEVLALLKELSPEAPKAQKNKVTIRMRRDTALGMGLLVCRCGHPLSNHFEFRKRPCARCTCKEYREVASAGELVD